MANSNVSLNWYTEIEDGFKYKSLTRRDSLHTNPATLENTTANDLMEFSDSESWGNNYHDFVGKAKFIYNITMKYSDAGTAKAVLYDIVVSGEFSGN